MRLVLMNGVLLALVGLAILGVIMFDRAEASVEGVVRRYALAVSSGDLDGALDEIAPPEREQWREWLSTQLGNIYDVRGIAVHSPSLLSGRRGPYEVTVVLDVNRGYPDDYYQPTSRVGVETVEGRWFLSQPLLIR
ncbi:MAG TPA: hypothetical protein VGL99_14785 [Chloroflexota bacterium]